MNTAIQKQTSGLIGYLALLTFIFFLIEISFTIQMSGFYFGDFKLAASHIAIPFRVVPGIVFFVFAQFLVHVSFTLLIWALARLIGIATRCSWHTTQNVGFVLWGLGLIVVLLANQIYFPNSKYAEITRVVFYYKFAKMIFIYFSGLSILALSVALWGLIRLASQYRNLTISLGFILFAAGLAHHFTSQPLVLTQADSKEKPNIFIIGVDAIRPDFLSYFGSLHLTPHFDEFLNQATVFGEAMTPIARTFPAWSSLLTGEYPKQDSARYDLADQSAMDLSDTLPRILQQHGYETVFAMDETRFSNIDTNFGFDQVVTPPIGFNDFLLGTFNDFPFSNLIVNTVVGHWLFPYSYGNRPAYVTYNPNSFLKLLQPVIAASHVKPLFLAVHFCLPHYPYFWQSYSYMQGNRAIINYQAAVIRADQQLADFLAMLKQNGLLAHSIVVLLSDHGEALELHGDRITDRDRFMPALVNQKTKIPRFYPPSYDTEKLNQSAGHGTDVLSFTQYHSVLAVRLYGLQGAEPNLVPGIVSLLDIKPTILSMLNIPYAHASGISLSDVVQGKKSDIPSRGDFFMESDFSPQSIRRAHPEARDVLFEGIDYFQINPLTTRLTVKQSMGQLILSSKQFADINGQWVLALYPQSNGYMMPILVNLESGEWTNDLRSSFAHQAPAQQMVSALQHFYGKEIKPIENS